MTDTTLLHDLLIAVIVGVLTGVIPAVISVRNRNVVKEVHRQTQPSNGKTLAHTTEEALQEAKEAKAYAKQADANSTRLLSEQARLAVVFGLHLRDHGDSR